MTALRLSTAAALAALLLLHTAPARAQYMTHEWVLSAGGGLSDPTGEFEQQVKLGGHFTVDAGHYLNPSWLVGVRVGYFAFAAESAWRAASGLDRIGYWSGDVETRLSLYPESWFSPYVAGGLGANLEKLQYADPTGPRQVEVLRIGFTGGVGLFYHRERTPVSVFTELVYHHFPTPDGSRQFLRWTTGLRFSVGGRPF